MTVIEEIKAKLSKYPDIRYEEENDYIVVVPSTAEGFEIGLTVVDAEYKVNFEGWYERFDQEAEALDYFVWGLTNACRLKEYRCGGVAYRWTLETKDKSEWKRVGTVSLFFYPFWKEKEIRYRQNNLITGQNNEFQESA
jgi:hypothetical protein